MTNRTEAIATVLALLSAGFTIRDVADHLRAHPRAIEALLR